MGLFGPDMWDVKADKEGVFRGPQHLLITINGAGVTMWDGYQSDLARALCRAFPFFAHQPIGFDSRPAPMKPGIDQGTAEVIRQLTEVHPTGTVIFIVYSEGAIIGSNILDLLRDPASPIHHRLPDVVAAVAFGNPRREKEHGFPGGIVTSGFGIVTPNLQDTPTWWWDFANGDETPGSGGEDLYATCSDASGVALANMRAIWKIVYSGNPSALAKEIGKALIMPWRWGGAAKAMIKAARFFGSGTRPHIDYHVSFPIAGDPRDSWKIAGPELTDDPPVS
jgi:hypothetical protein